MPRSVTAAPFVFTYIYVYVLSRTVLRMDFWCPLNRSQSERAPEILQTGSGYRLDSSKLWFRFNYNQNSLFKGLSNWLKLALAEKNHVYGYAADGYHSHFELSCSSLVCIIRDAGYFSTTPHDILSKKSVIFLLSRG